MDRGAASGSTLTALFASNGGVLAPAEEVQDVVADRDALGVGGDDLADGAALHGLAELEGGGVGLGGAHAAAHVRVDGQVLVAHQDLALGRAASLGLDQGEVLGLRPADGAGDEVPFAVDGGELRGVVMGGAFPWGSGSNVANTSAPETTMRLNIS